jgi:F-type H+-transporting ATPase subunit b
MNLIFLMLQEQEHGAAGGADPNVFNLVTGVSFWTVIIFLLLLVVLSKFAFPPILGYAAAREKRIQDNLDDAKRQREEAERILEEQRKELAAARTQGQQLILEARQAADRSRQDLLTRARMEQEEIVARATKDIQQEREKAVELIRQQAVDLALAAAGRLLEKRLDADEDRRLVLDYLNRTAPTGKGKGAN